jgi:hypothetical protein
MRSYLNLGWETQAAHGDAPRAAQELGALRRYFASKS